MSGRCPTPLCGKPEFSNDENVSLFLKVQDFIIKSKRFELGLARLIEISVNRSIYKRKTIIDMKIQKSVTFNGCSVLFIQLKFKRNCLLLFSI